MKLKLSGMKYNTMNKKYHMYDVTSPKFQDKEINIPDNKIIDNDVLPPPTKRFLFTFKPIDKQLIITEQTLGDDSMIDDILEHVTEILTNFNNSNQMTYEAYSTLYDAICIGMQQAYDRGKHDGVEQYLREREEDEEWE